MPAKGLGARLPQCYGVEVAPSGAKIWVFLRAVLAGYGTGMSRYYHHD
jgi:hypothetical protein